MCTTLQATILKHTQRGQLIIHVHIAELKSLTVSHCTAYQYVTRVSHETITFNFVRKSHTQSTQPCLHQSLTLSQQ